MFAASLIHSFEHFYANNYNSMLEHKKKFLLYSQTYFRSTYKSHNKMFIRQYHTGREALIVPLYG